jgi:hypothetical protein
LFVVVAVGAEKFSATVTFGDEFNFGGGEVVVCRDRREGTDGTTADEEVG